MKVGELDQHEAKPAIVICYVALRLYFVNDFDCYYSVMRKFSVLIVGVLVIIGYIVADKRPGTVTADIASQHTTEETSSTAQPLILVGQGGDVGYQFLKAADTYAKEHGGLIVQVDSGDEFVEAIESFVAEHQTIDEFVYFGHGNEVGLYVNQAPRVNGAVYANDPVLNEPFSAASIYDLPRNIFATGATALFFGCNVAHETSENDSFAELFSNHFGVTVKASSGPTEFSLNPESPQSPPKDGEVPALYMVPTAARKGFVTLEPRVSGVGGFDDVHVLGIPSEAIEELTKLGLKLGSEKSYQPYKTITYEEAQKFCQLINPDTCDIGSATPTEQIRNLAALKMLLDATNIDIKQTSTLHEGEIYYARNNNLLTHDFTHKRWYTRGEMAILTRNILHHIQSIQVQ